MRFSPQFLDELRARLPASEVVGRRVKLRKAGREWKGLSPFNKEKTPSFFVNDQKAMWFDFSSGKNGNIFDFVMQTEGVSFPEAVERLAARAGIELTYEQGGHVPGHEQSRRRRLLAAHQAAADEGNSLTQVVEAILDRYLRHGMADGDQAPRPASRSRYSRSR